MTQCYYCGIDFLLLPDSGEPQNNRCGKCKLRIPGLSQPELADINDKPQCATCGVASSIIKKPLCNGCIEKYKTMEDVPRSVLKLSGMAALLLGETTPGSGIESDLGHGLSSDALSIISSAVNFQAQASDPRLKSKPSTTRGADGASGLNKYKNLAKANQMVAERKKQKDEVRLAGVANVVKICATLWTIGDSSRGGRMTEIAGIRMSQVFGPERTTQYALNVLLNDVSKSWVQRNPDAEPLTWSIINLYAHENQTRYSSLDYFDRNRTVAQFLQEFVNQKLASDAMLKDRKVDIRFAFYLDQVFADSGSTNESYRPSTSRSKVSSMIKTSSMAKTVSKKARSQLSSSLNTRLQVASASGPEAVNGVRSSFKFAVPEIPKRTSFLRSAFIPPSAPPQSLQISTPPQMTWSRDVAMNTSSFYRTTASWLPRQGLKVNFKTMETQEKIEIAQRWDKKSDPGYIGEGFTKRGVYARFMGKEYVITQPIDHRMDEDSVKSVLNAEFSLLCIGNTLKHEFDQHAKDCGTVSIPKFYFNFKDAFIGQLAPTITSGSRYLPHCHFIATPMLPWGDVDSKIKKFTGNDEFGYPEDNLTKAIHAFSHYTAVYTQNSLVLCDLQGLYDREKNMCLIDPQGHTSSQARDSDNSCYAYWDGGLKKMMEYLKKHESVCRQNWICTALDLSDAIIMTQDDVTSPAKAVEHSQKRKHGSGDSY